MEAGISPVFDVCVMGLGYVGLPTAAVLASRGLRVLGVDVRSDVVETVARGGVHIAEPELDALVQSVVRSGALATGAVPAEAATFLLCVPTPFGPGHAPDLSYVEAATRAVAEVARPGALVVLESTSPPGTTRNVVAALLAEAGLVAGRDVHVAHAPERVLPGAVLREVVDNPRVVGGVTEACTEACALFYEKFVRGEILRTTAEVAELTKLSENAYRDVNVAFANELANVCERLDVDPWEVIALANRHPRVEILRPGPGVGGHCIAVDPWFIVAAAPDDTPLLRAARAVNDARPERLIARVAALAERFKHPRIACLGLSYKADTDDVRESPAIRVVRGLADRFAAVSVADPYARVSPVVGVPLLPAEEAVAGADVVVLLVAHRAFRRLRPDLLLQRSVVDACGLLAR